MEKCIRTHAQACHRVACMLSYMLGCEHVSAHIKSEVGRSKFGKFVGFMSKYCQGHNNKIIIIIKAFEVSYVAKSSMNSWNAIQLTPSS